MFSSTGFEFTPAGQLLKQTVDLSLDMGVAYERSVGFYKEFHSHDRDIIIFPRGACRMEVKTRMPHGIYSINSTEALYVPRGITHDDRSISSVYDTLALLPGDKLMRELAIDNALTASDVRTLRTKCFKVKRSSWLDELIGRFFVERILGATAAKNSIFFLGKQILNELVRLIFVGKFNVRGEVLGGHVNEIVPSALTYIESYLFEEINLQMICRATKCNASTLQRAFKKTLNCSVGGYIKNRRLDEAAALVKGGAYQIGDICLLVGYSDLSSFTRSFREKFGVAPTKY